MQWRIHGVADYIRTYTLDKKLESWVKDSAFLGGGTKGEPTIIGPKQYRQRFLSAMERYFPLVGLLPWRKPSLFMPSFSGPRSVDEATRFTRGRRQCPP